jgi:hypothetical protein
MTSTKGTTAMTGKSRTSRYPATRASLAVGSFLAFSALTAYFAARGMPGDAQAGAPAAQQPVRIVVVQPNGETQAPPAPRAAVRQPVTRTRGS